MHIAAVVLAEILLAEILANALVQNYQSLDDAIEKGKSYAEGHRTMRGRWQAFEVWRRLLEEDRHTNVKNCPALSAGMNGQRVR